MISIANLDTENGWRWRLFPSKLGKPSNLFPVWVLKWHQWVSWDGCHHMFFSKIKSAQPAWQRHCEPTDFQLHHWEKGRCAQACSVESEQFWSTENLGFKPPYGYPYGLHFLKWFFIDLYVGVIPGSLDILCLSQCWPWNEINFNNQIFSSSTFFSELDLNHIFECRHRTGLNMNWLWIFKWKVLQQWLQYHLSVIPTCTLCQFSSF